MCQECSNIIAADVDYENRVRVWTTRGALDALAVYGIAGEVEQVGGDVEVVTVPRESFVVVLNEYGVGVYTLEDWHEGGSAEPWTDVNDFPGQAFYVAQALARRSA